MAPEFAAKFWEINAHDHQKAPAGGWTTWLLLGGRGAGKTRAGAEWVRALAAAANDNALGGAIALVAETYNDAREIMIEGPSGIRAVAADDARPDYEVSRRRLVWPNGAALYRSAGGAGEGAPILAGLAPARAIMGRLQTSLPPAGSGRRVHRAVDVRLSFGALSSKAAEDVFAGANLFAVKSAAGGWEVAQFETAALLESGVWRLSGLLRGQAGSEAEALAGAEEGARFVLLNAAVTQAAFAANLRGLSLDWQAGPEADLPGTANFTSANLTMTARGLKPLSPVHLRARRDGDDIRLSWIRRTRQGGDSWEGEVPLAELSERYRVSVFDGETPVRTVETTAPDYLYAAADIVSDFGGGIETWGPGATLSFSVAQISDAVGEGLRRRALLC